MSFKDIPPLGQALLVIGGSFLVGAIINELTNDDEDETSRESHLTLGPRNVDNNIRRNPQKDLSKRYYKVEVSKPKQTTNSLDVLRSPISGDRKYHDDYYRLSKSQQYKYRQKMAEKLIQLSHNR